DAFLRGHGFFGARVHDHAIGDRRSAGRQGLGRLFDVDQAHAAVGGDGQFLVIAEMRYVDAQLVRGLDDHAAFGSFYGKTVDGEFNHLRILTLQIFWHHAALVLDVVCELVAVMLDETAHRHGGGVAQRTNGAAHDVLRDRIQGFQIFRTALAVFDAVDDAVQPARALAARRALDEP